MTVYPKTTSSGVPIFNDPLSKYDTINVSGTVDLSPLAIGTYQGVLFF